MTYLFGDFELSEEDFSLSRHGERLALEPRALRLLLVLAGSSGKLLEKKTLLDAVWTDTFVEESTLTRAIAILRKQLDDDPRAPKFIQTVPTRGYRFIAPVTTRNAIDLPAQRLSPDAAVPEADATGPRSESALSNEAAPRDVTDDDFTVSDAVRLPRRKRIFAVAAAIGALAIAVPLIFVLSSRGGPRLNSGDTLVLAGFSNSSGDPVFDDALREGMMVQLEQSPVLRLASEDQIQNTLRLMGAHADTALTPGISREICQRLGGTVVLNGSVARLGSAYVIALRARSCSTGDILASEQVQIQRKEDALHALDQIATRFRKRLGESSSTIHDLNAPLAEATTSSLDALKAFSLGMRNFNAKGSSAALPLFQHATELDPDFAEAHVWLGRMYADLGQEDLAIESTRRAYQLRDRASDRERFTIDVSYDLLVTGNLEKARATCDAWSQLYPRDVYPRNFLSALVYPAYGQYERALDEAKQSIAIDPGFVVGYRNAAINLLALHRPDEAEQVLKQASERKVFLPSFVSDSYRIAFLKGDTQRMQQALASAPRNPWLLSFHAATLAQAGKLTEAQTLHDEARHLSQQAAKREMEAHLLLVPAYTCALYGYPQKAAENARTAIHLSTSRDVAASAALVLAMSGASSEAIAIADDLQKRFPEDTLLRLNRLPTIRAAVALAQNSTLR